MLELLNQSQTLNKLDMAYEHVTSLPFLLDSSHLTPDEIAERDENPALFAAKRYGQPEYIFRTAGQFESRDEIDQH